MNSWMSEDRTPADVTVCWTVFQSFQHHFRGTVDPDGLHVALSLAALDTGCFLTATETSLVLGRRLQKTGECRFPPFPASGKSYSPGQAPGAVPLEGDHHKQMAPLSPRLCEDAGVCLPSRQGLSANESASPLSPTSPRGAQHTFPGSSARASNTPVVGVSRPECTLCPSLRRSE